MPSIYPCSENRIRKLENVSTLCDGEGLIGSTYESMGALAAISRLRVTLGPSRGH